MSVIELLSTPVFNAIAWALLSSLWQAAIIYALIWMLLQVNKQTSAHLKHSLAGGAQIIIAIWMVITFIQHLQLNKDAVASIESSQAAILFNPIHLPLMEDLYNVTETSPVVLNVATLLPIFLLLYLTGLIFMGWRMLVGYQQTRLLRKQSLTNVGDDLYQLLENIKSSLQVNQRVQLYISGLVNSPILIGFLRPVILLPLSIFTQLSPEQIKAILIHEIAHIRRMDYLINYLQCFLEAILFFNPFVWLLSKIMRDQREKACDEWVVREISPQSYAAALLALEVARKEAVMAMAAKRKAHYPLLNRIKAFTMNPVNNSTKANFKQKMISVFLILLSVSCLAWLAPSKSKKSDAKAIIADTTGVNQDAHDSNKSTHAALNSNINRQTKQQSAKRRNVDHASDTTILSPAFQEQLKKLQESAKTISSNFENNPEWDEAIKAFQEKAKSMGESFKMDPKFEEQLANLGKEAGAMAQQKVNSPAFKKQIKAMQLEAAKIKERAASDSTFGNKAALALSQNARQLMDQFKQDPEWQAKLQAIQEQAKAISSKFANNPEWDKSIKELAAQASQLSKSMVESPAFKEQLEKIKQQAAQLKFEAERQEKEAQ